MTNFPNGVSSFGMPMTPAQAANIRTGRVYWVSNNSTTPRSDVKVGQDIAHPAGGTFNRPFATIDYAIGQCRANAGDTILVKEGHAETMTATSLVVDVAGITIIGLGSGASKPTLTFNGTADIITISGASTVFQNFRIVAAVGDVVTAFDVTAVDVKLLDIEATESSTFNFINIVTCSGAANTADRLHIARLYWVSDDAGSDGIVTTAGSIDGLLIEDCNVQLAAGVAAGLLVLLAADQQLTGFVARRNVLMSALVDTAGILVGGTAATSSGFIYENHIRSLDAAGAAFLAAATTPIVLGNNWYTGALAEPLAINTVGATIYNNA